MIINVIHSLLMNFTDNLLMDLIRRMPVTEANDVTCKDISDVDTVKHSLKLNGRCRERSHRAHSPSCASCCDGIPQHHAMMKMNCINQKQHHSQHHAQ